MSGGEPRSPVYTSDPRILVFAGFRCHILLAHDVVGGIQDGQPIWPGLTVEGGIFRRNGEPVLLLDTHVGPKRTRVVVTALTDIWIQEPGLTVKVAGEGTWRGFGPEGQWTSPVYTLKQKEPGVPQAYRSTVHFPRNPKHQNYTVGVEWRMGAAGIEPAPVGLRPSVPPLHHAPAKAEALDVQKGAAAKHSGTAYRFLSDGGFSKLLNVPPGNVPWQDCQVTARPWKVTGTVPDLSGRSRHRWELAGHPESAWFHAFGWTGGSGAVVNSEGRTPAPGQITTAADGYDKLFDPPGWRCLGKGQHISQTLSMRRLER